MSDWKERLNVWLAARTKRERWLVYTVSFFLIIAIGDQLLTAPLQSRLRSVQTQIESEQEIVAELQAEVAKLSVLLSQDPNHALRERIAQLKADHAVLDEALRELTVGLIQPAEMTKVLREMLVDEKGLSLVRLANGQGEPVILTAAAGDAAGGAEAKAEEEPRLFRHTLIVEVEGGYLDALRYLKRLEALQWTFYWDGIELNVDKYPKSRIVIRLSTLGLREGWIGV